MSGAGSRGRQERGFTLIEVLVALFIIGLIASLLLSVLDMQRRSQSAVRLHTNGNDSVVAAQTALRGRLEAMRAVPDLRSSGGALTMHGGTSDIDFDAPLFASAGPHALHHFRLRLGQDRTLMLYSTSARTSADASGPSLLGWDRVRLIENIERLEITYYGQDSFSGRDVWQERWGYQSVLPKLVRVQLTFPAGDARFWPMLMVKTSPQQKPGCGPDGQSPDCRGAT